MDGQVAIHITHVSRILDPPHVLEAHTHCVSSAFVIGGSYGDPAVGEVSHPHRVAAARALVDGVTRGCAIVLVDGDQLLVQKHLPHDGRHVADVGAHLRVIGAIGV